MIKISNTKSKGFTRKNFSKKNLGGFTLIELLIVIAIIGILAGVVLSSLNSARSKGRDAKRNSDIHQIHNALALYYDDFEKYPDSTGPTRSNDATDWGDLSAELAPYMSTLPADPLNDSSYYYIYETTDVLSTDYTLTAIYEREVENTITILNPVSNLASTYGTSPRTISIITPTPGNMLVVAVWDSGGVGGNTVTDNQGNEYTPIYSFSNSSSEQIQIYRSNNLAGTMPTSLSVSWSSGGSRVARVQMQEMSGVSSVNPVDFTGLVSGYVEGGVLTFSTANANEAAFAYVHLGEERDYSIAEPGYSRTPAGAVSPTLLYGSNLGASGNKTISLSWVGATGATVGLVTFNPE